MEKILNTIEIIIAAILVIIPLALVCQMIYSLLN
jgi:hypothetical protein